MKKSLFILIVFFSYEIYSQSFNSYKSSDGTNFKVGDTITIAKPYKGRNNYESINVFYKTNYSNGYKSLEENLDNQKFIIKNISNNSEVFFINKLIFTVGNSGFLSKRYFVDIESAIKYGEIVTQNTIKSNIKSEILTNELAFSIFSNIGNIDPELYKKEYLYRFNNKLYNEVYQDEFKLNKALNYAKQELTNKINFVDTSIVYTLNTKLNFDSYDFTNNGFSIVEKDISFKVMDRVSVNSNANSYYSPFIVNFLNFSDFSFFKMNPEDAEKLINRRKDSNGKVNRIVYCKLYFKINSIMDISELNDVRKLQASIYKIDVYEFETLSGNFLGEIFPLLK